jgi:hypothetical protein
MIFWDLPLELTVSGILIAKIIGKKKIKLYPVAIVTEIVMIPMLLGGGGVPLQITEIQFCSVKHLFEANVASKVTSTCSTHSFDVKFCSLNRHCCLLPFLKFT